MSRNAPIWYGSDYYQQLAKTASTLEQRVAATGESPSETGTDASSTRETASGAPVAASGLRVAASENPSGPEPGSSRVIRGGSWSRDAGGCRSACRNRVEPSFRHGNLGFRLSRTGPWSSYPLTLGGRPPETLKNDNKSQEKEAMRISDQDTPESPRQQPLFKPRQGFRDRFAIVTKDAEQALEAPEMVYLPGGTFSMGDERGRDREKLVHLVRIADFAIGRTPVTWGEYKRFCERLDRHWPEWLEPSSAFHLETGSDSYYSRRGIAYDALDLPVVGISWHDALAYCEWLSERTGERYRLPTEAEWEYACRAGTETRWSCGDAERDLEEHAWYSANAGGIVHPVAKKRPNPWGLYDLHGNVWEWCADWYSERYYQQLASALEQSASKLEQRAAAPRKTASAPRAGASSAREFPSGAPLAASENPSGPESGSYRVIRGGSWLNVADSCRSAFRYRIEPSIRNDLLGFRLSRTV